MATAAGYHIQDPAELATLKEGDIARISGSDSIYRRDLAREQEAMKTYTGGRGTAELDQTFNKFVYVGPDAPSTPTMPEAPTTDDVATGMADMPSPPEGTAGAIQEEFVKLGSQTSQRADAMSNVFQQQLEDNRKEQEELRKQEADQLARRDETVGQMGDLMQDDIRTRLETAGNNEFDLKEKYQKHTELTNGLVEFTEQALGMINTEKQRVGIAAIKGGRISNMMDDIDSKIALSQTSLAAIEGNIALGRSFIDRGIEAAVADRADNLSYLNFVYELAATDLSETKGKILDLTTEEKTNLERQMALLDSELVRIEEEKDMVADFLVGDNAYAALQAGVNLTDTYDEMVEKVVNYYKENPNQIFLQGLTSGQRLTLGESGMTFGDDGSLVTVAATEMPGTGSSVTTVMGNGVVTAYGSSAWSHGLDMVMSGGKGASLSLPNDYEVISVENSCKTGDASCNSGFGNQVKVRMNGREIWFSHLDSVNVSPGTYTAGTSIGTQGNTGKVIASAGGDGTHVDITMPKSSGGYYTPEEVADFLEIGGTTPVDTGIPTYDEFAQMFKDDAMAQGATVGMSPYFTEGDIKAAYDELMQAFANQGISTTNDYSNTYQGYSLGDLKDLVSQDSDQEKMGFLNLSPNSADDIKKYLSLKSSDQLNALLSGDDDSDLPGFSNTQQLKLEREFGENWKDETTRQQQLDFIFQETSGVDKLTALLED